MSLKGIRVQVKTKKDFRKVCEHIEVCLILHNLMIDFNDEWVEEIEIPDMDVGRVDHLISLDEDDDQDEVQDEMDGKELRRRVQTFVLAWYHAKN